MATASLLSEYSLSDAVYQAATTMPDEATTRTIVFTSQKGGSGKTTLCGQLAVQAELAGHGPVALIDTDPQGSLADWWNARGDETPMFVRTSVDNLYETIDDLHKMGVKLVFIDTPPTVTDTIQDIIRHGDLVVIPTRPSPHDLRAVGPTIELVEQSNKPMIFAINCATRRARLTGDVAVALSQHGTVAPTIVHNRIDFATSMIDGKSVMESNPDGKSAAEIQSLWGYIDERLRRLEKDDGYQTYQSLVKEPRIPVTAVAPPVVSVAIEVSQASPEAFQMRETEPHNRRRSKEFGRRKSDGFGLALTEAQ